MRLGKVGGMLALWIGCAMGQSVTPTWSHNPAVTNGPLHWGGITPSYETCGNAPPGSPTVAQVGMAQTPVDILTAKAVLALLPQINFQYDATPFEVENTGHVVEVVYDSGSSIRVGWSVTDIYQLIQFHFHAPSEHKVNGNRYDAELHLVHKNVLGQLAVVGVLLSQSDTAPSGIFDQILMAAPATVGTGTLSGTTLNADSLLPEDQDYFTYAGSLSTPPCTEGVRWFVMQTPVQVSPYVIQQLHLLAAQFPGYDGFADNDRPIVPLNGRTILSTF
ncbi:MAG: carbonic anhydrase family protein [Bryobacteraceae bacterium]